jgi:hypothetical protein
MAYTGHTQKNGAVSKVCWFETAPFFCVCPVYGGAKVTTGNVLTPEFSAILHNHVVRFMGPENLIE